MTANKNKSRIDRLKATIRKRDQTITRLETEIEALKKKVAWYEKT